MLDYSDVTTTHMGMQYGVPSHLWGRAGLTLHTGATAPPSLPPNIPNKRQVQHNKIISLPPCADSRLRLCSKPAPTLLTGVCGLLRSARTLLKLRCMGENRDSYRGETGLTQYNTGILYNMDYIHTE